MSKTKARAEGKAAQGLGRKLPRDKQWETLEATRKRKEMLMLQSLKRSLLEGNGDTALLSREEMQGPEYEGYWKNITLTAKVKRTGSDDTNGARQFAQRALKFLLDMHIGMSPRQAENQVMASIKSLPVWRKKGPIFFHTGDTESTLERHRRLIKPVENEISLLEARLAIEKWSSPLEDPGEWEKFYEKVKELSEEKMTRKTARAIWRRNRNIAAFVQRGEANRKKAEAEWLAGIHEIECTLQAFKRSLEQHMEDTAEKNPMVTSENAKEEMPVEMLDSYRQDQTRSAAAEAKSDIQPKGVTPKEVSINTDARLQQLRDISQSISYLKKSAASTPVGNATLSTAAQIKEALLQLEKKTSDLAANDAEPRQLPESDVMGTSTAQTGRPSIRFSNQNPNATHESRLTKALLSESNQPEPPRPAWPEPSSTRTLSDQLKAQVPISGEVRIDDDLTVSMQADVPALQNQIFELSQRLKKAYPLMDTLPYDVWNSEKRPTLQMWLKILIRKWQTRNDVLNESAEAKVDINSDVRTLLDQMVLDHDLDRRAAVRMVKRWAMVFEKKEKRAMGIAQVEEELLEKLDWDEMDPGMGWLRDEGETVEEERTKVEEERTKVAPVEQSGHQLPDDLPFSFGKRRDYRRGATVAWEAGASRGYHALVSRRHYSTSPRVLSNSTPCPTTESPSPTQNDAPESTIAEPRLPHLTPSGSAHMVSVSNKARTIRTAVAVGSIHFSNPTALSLIRSNSLKKGDVLSVSRIAGIMAAKKCPDLVPLCHPIMLTHVALDLHVFDAGFGGIEVEAKVQCEGQTGVEMEALTSVMGAALSVVDMCKAVDKGIVVQNVRVVLKEGGRSGTWREEGWRSIGEQKSMQQ